MRLIDGDALYNGAMKDEYFRFKEKDKSGREAFAYSCAMQRLVEAPTIQPDAPRVMTLEEVLTADKPFFIEKPSNEDGDKEWRGWGIVDTEDREAGTIMFAVIGKSERLLCDVETMGEYFRCWTARPTDEQREAVKWDE